MLSFIYALGLFVPLANSDSAHHANIALNMFLTGDYINLMDQGKDYLDKPHMLFWVSALSYHLFGVTTFAYKFPSFLFSVFGIYVTFRLGKTLYNSETGRLAALIIASAFGYILANNDVRMEAMLTAAIAFATWQGVEWVNNKKIINAVGIAIGLALGFCVKGHISVITSVMAIFFYILYWKDWKSFYHRQLIVIILLFLTLIAPVLYCYYLQFDLHPEKIIRGQSNRSGVAFILWQQIFERFEGKSFTTSSDKDYLFFIHSFLWVFAPWSVLTFVALYNRFKTLKTQEWLTIGTFIGMGLLINFSGFKLPHYLHILFPVSAVITGAYLLLNRKNPKLLVPLWILQVVVCMLCLIITAALNVWSFPIQEIITGAGLILLIGIGVFVFRMCHNELQRLIALSALTSILILYLLNANFFPQLLTYQSGNQLASATKGVVDPQDVFFLPGQENPSYKFYTQRLREEFSDSVYVNKDVVWVLTNTQSLPALEEKGLPIKELITHKNYRITKLKWDFLNPANRAAVLDTTVMVRVK